MRAGGADDLGASCGDSTLRSASSSSSIQCRTGTAARRPAGGSGSRCWRWRSHCGAAVLQRRELARAQLAGDLRLQERVGARRAAAQVRVAHRRQLVAGARQQRLDLAADLLAVLQRAGRLEGDPRRGLRSRAPAEASRRRPPRTGRASAPRCAPPCRGSRGSCASRWPYSFTVTPQPLAVITIASTSPRSTSGHQASISARMSSRPSSWSFRWKRSAPQQPAPGASMSEMPRRSSTRAAAALIDGASAGCTQPPSTSILRAWRGAGHARRGSASCAGSSASALRGSTGAAQLPDPQRSARTARCAAGRRRARRASAGPSGPRAVRCSTTARPMSTSRP